MKTERILRAVERLLNANIKLFKSIDTQKDNISNEIEKKESFIILTYMSIINENIKRIQESIKIIEENNNHENI